MLRRISVKTVLIGTPPVTVTRTRRQAQGHLWWLVLVATWTSCLQCPYDDESDLPSAETWDFFLAFARKNDAQNLVFHHQTCFRESQLMTWFSALTLSGGQGQGHGIKSLPVAFVSFDETGLLPPESTLTPTLHVVWGPLSAHFLVTQIFGSVNEEDQVEHEKIWYEQYQVHRREHYWLLQLPDVNDVAAVEAKLSNLPLRYDSKLFVFSIDQQNKSEIPVREVYRLHASYVDQMEVAHFGTWYNSENDAESEDGLATTGVNMWERRTDLKGHKFRISVLVNAPYITHVEDGCTNRSCLKGMYADAWHALQDVMNFTYVVKLPAESSWGNLVNGSWTGMIGMLLNDTIDISPAEFTITSERATAVDFNVPIATSHQKLFVKNPAESPNWTAFIEPLTWSCWFVLLMLVVLIPPFLTANAFALANEPNRSSLRLTGSLALFTGSLALLSPLSTTPKRVRNRIAFISVFFSGSLIYWHWEAMLISFLQVRKTVLPFNSLEELYTSTDYNLIVQPGTSYVDLFRVSTNPIMTAIYKERIEPYIAGYPLGDKLALHDLAVSSDGFALYDNFYASVTYEPYKTCQVIPIPVEYFPVQFAYAFQKDSPYFDAFWYQLNKMKERGALQQITRKYEEKDQVCPDYAGKPLGLGQSFTAFITLFIGMGVGFLCLVGEFSSRRLLSAWRANQSLNPSSPHETWSQWAAKIREREQLQQSLAYHEGQLAKHRGAIAGIRHKMDIGDNSFNRMVNKDNLRRRRKAALASVVTSKQ